MSWKKIKVAILFVCILGIAGGCRSNNPRSNYMVKVLEVDTNKYGYQIVLNERTVIMQPFVPGISGIRYFTSPDDARRVGELVSERLTKGLEYTVTRDDLQRLKILDFIE